MGPNEAAWSALVARVGEEAIKVNEALTSAMQVTQQRLGALPDGYDHESWDDLYGLAFSGYLRLTAAKGGAR